MTKKELKKKIITNKFIDYVQSEIIYSPEMGALPGTRRYYSQDQYLEDEIFNNISNEIHRSRYGNTSFSKISDKKQIGNMFKLREYGDYGSLETISFIGIVDPIRHKLDKGLKLMGLDCNLEYNICSIPLGSFGISSSYHDSRNSVIIVNEGLFVYIYDMSKVMVTMLTSIHGDDLHNFLYFGERNLDHNTLKSIERFIKLFNYNVVKRKSTEVEISLTSNKNRTFVLMLTEISELFLIAHEYAHIYFGHVERKFNDKENKITNEDYIKMEYEADNFAFDLVMRVFLNEKMDFFYIHLGIEYCMGLSILDQTYKEIEPLQHPDFSSRIKNIRRKQVNFKRQDTENVFQACDSMHKKIDLLYGIYLQNEKLRTEDDSKRMKFLEERIKKG